MVWNKKRNVFFVMMMTMKREVRRFAGKTGKTGVCLAELMKVKKAKDTEGEKERELSVNVSMLSLLEKKYRDTLEEEEEKPREEKETRGEEEGGAGY